MTAGGVIDHSGPTSGHLVISDDKIPFSAYQAIYHKITRRVEILRRSYSNAVTISHADLTNLHLGCRSVWLSTK